MADNTRGGKFEHEAAGSMANDEQVLHSVRAPVFRELSKHLVKFRDEQLSRRQQDCDRAIMQAKETHDQATSEINAEFKATLDKAEKDPLGYWLHLQTLAKDGNHRGDIPPPPPPPVLSERSLGELAQAGLANMDPTTPSDVIIVGVQSRAPTANMIQNHPSSSGTSVRRPNKNRVAPNMAAGDQERSAAPITNAQRRFIEEQLNSLAARSFSAPFYEPVDPSEVEDYYDVVDRPMALRTVIENLETYATPKALMDDFDLILEAARAYNEPDSDIVRGAIEMSCSFKRDMQDIPDASVEHYHCRPRQQKRRVRFADMRKIGPDPLEQDDNERHPDYIPE